MFRLPLALVLLLIAVPSAGQSLPADAGPLRAVIAASACADLVTHVPSADTAYRPGVDAAGRPVAPADLPGAPRIDLPDIYRIAIQVDLADRYGIPDEPGLFEGTVRIGTVSVVGDRLFFNDQPLTPVDEAAVVRACRAAARR